MINPMRIIKDLDFVRLSGTEGEKKAVALICDFVYENDKIVDLIPKYFSAFNDFSIRIQDGNKLSTKKNWGAGSKGIATEFIEIDNFEEDGILSKFHIASFIRRDGVLRDYGTVSAVKSYSYFFNQLKTLYFSNTYKAIYLFNNHSAQTL